MIKRMMPEVVTDYCHDIGEKGIIVQQMVLLTLGDDSGFSWGNFIVIIDYHEE